MAKQILSYEKLLQYCKSDTQQIYIEACIKHGSMERAAKALGLNNRTVERNVKLVREYAMKYGKEALIGTVSDPIPDHFYIKGSSTLYDAETGEAKIAWIKTDVDKDKMLKAALESFTASIESYKPLPKVKAPTKTDKSLMTIYPMGDPHIGMYAWSAEAGEDFDCDIAERNLREAMAHLVSKSPNTETAVILNLGDFFHSDTQENRTARAGNALDVDGRWARVLEIGITLMIDCVNLALEKHKKVIVKNNIGNHDTHTSQVLSICMQHSFKNNPRVEIVEPANPFFAYQFGRCSIYSTHGHMVKPKNTHGWVTNYYPRDRDWETNVAYR